MEFDKALENIPPEGFLKVTRDKNEALKPRDKAALLRKANEMANEGNWEAAKRIFVTTGNTDGMIRVGDHYLKKGKPLLALQMYKLAPAPDKAEPLIEKMASVVRHWLKES